MPLGFPDDVYVQEPYQVTNGFEFGADTDGAPHGYAIPILPTGGLEVDELEHQANAVGPRYRKPGTIVVYDEAEWKLDSIRSHDIYVYVYEFKWRKGRLPEHPGSLFLEESRVGKHLRPRPLYNIQRGIHFSDHQGNTWTAQKHVYETDDRHKGWHYLLALRGYRGEPQTQWQSESKLCAKYGWVLVEL